VGAKDTIVIVSVLFLGVRPGKSDELVEAFDRLQVFERSRENGGFLGARLLRPLEPNEPLAVVAEWEDAAAYARWLDNPVRAELARELEPLLAEHPPAGGLYEVAL
jgi:heme-degrading monooxygenase HmoA